MAKQMIRLIFSTVKRFSFPVLFIALFLFWASEPHIKPSVPDVMNDIYNPDVKSYGNTPITARVAFVRQNRTIYFQYDQFKYLYNADIKCKYTRPFLLILVKSSVRYQDNRMGIRRTWGNVTDTRIKMVFMLGHNKSMETKIMHESNQYNDLVQFDFVDSYFNNSIKTNLAFDWVVQHCQEAQYVYFVDDDYFVNIPNLMKFLTNHRIKRTKQLIAGYKHVGWAPMRNHSNKWFIPKSVYPATKYPPFFSGGSIVMDSFLVKRIWSGIPYVKPFKLDDVFIGIVAKSLGIDLMAENRFEYRFHFFDKSKLHELLSAHNFGPLSKLLSKWKNLTCSYTDMFYSFYDQSYR